MNKIQEIIKETLIYCSKDGLTDKAREHSYEYMYPQLLESYYDKQNNILEVGTRYGGGLKFLHDCFLNSKIYGVDCSYGTLRINVNDFPRLTLLPECDQCNIDINLLPDLDIVTEDCSHIYEYSIKTFELLKPKLKSGAIYIIEDLLPEYVERYKTLQCFEIINLTHVKNRIDDICAVFYKN